MHGYDGHKNYTLKSGEYCVVRKNHLARYNKEKENDEFEKVILVFDESFLKKFQGRHKTIATKFKSAEAFIRINKNELIPNFIRSLMPYYNGSGKINKTFSDLKQEELILILFQAQPEISGVFFDYGIPEKINLEEFMNRNYKFNVSIERLAYLTE